MNYLKLVESIDDNNIATKRVLIENYTSMFEASETEIKKSFIDLLKKDPENYFLLPEDYQLDEDIIKVGQRLIKKKSSNYDKLIGDVKRDPSLIHTLLVRKIDYVNKIPEDVLESEDFKEYYNELKSKIGDRKGKSNVKFKKNKVNSKEEVNSDDSKAEVDSKVDTENVDKQENVDNHTTEPTNSNNVSEDKSNYNSTDDNVANIVNAIKERGDISITDIPMEYHKYNDIIKALLDTNGGIENQLEMLTSNELLSNKKNQESIMLSIIEMLKADPRKYFKIYKYEWVRNNRWVSKVAVHLDIFNVLAIPEEHQIDNEILPYTLKLLKSQPKYMDIISDVVKENPVISNFIEKNKPKDIEDSPKKSLKDRIKQKFTRSK
jgi:hypothetical protein